MISKGCCLLRPVKQHQQAKSVSGGQVSRLASAWQQSIRGLCVGFCWNPKISLPRLMICMTLNPVTKVKSHSRLSVSTIKTTVLNK